jgi:hypothetical protein
MFETEKNNVIDARDLFKKMRGITSLPQKRRLQQRFYFLLIKFNLQQCRSIE